VDVRVASPLGPGTVGAGSGGRHAGFAWAPPPRLLSWRCARRAVVTLSNDKLMQSCASERHKLHSVLLLKRFVDSGMR
jgi:hypothetical protein